MAVLLEWVCTHDVWWRWLFGLGQTVCAPISRRTNRATCPMCGRPGRAA